MKLAYFSPMPPARTGIATYSSQLLPALAEHFDITVFAPAPAEDVPAGMRAVDFVADPGSLKSIPTFDRAVYHIGNNPWFHLDILRAFLLQPDTVALHDTVLYYLAAGGGTGALLKNLLLAEPARAFSDLEEIFETSPDRDPLRYSTPSKHPCLAAVLDIARQVIVHNHAAAQAVSAAGFQGEINVIPLPHYAARHPSASRAEARALLSGYGLGENRVVFGAFGFIGPTKRLDKVLDAFGHLVARDGTTNARLLIVGEGDPIVSSVRARGLEKFVTLQGFVDDDNFRKLLASVDVVLNLRYPSHGESSASLIQAMSYGRPCLVSNDAAFCELPDDTVVKISYGGKEVDEIEHAMLQLIEDQKLRDQIGEAARRYVLANHAPGKVAEKYLQVLAGSSTCRTNDLTASVRDKAVVGVDAASYLHARVQSLIP